MSCFLFFRRDLNMISHILIQGLKKFQIAFQPEDSNPPSSSLLAVVC